MITTEIIENGDGRFVRLPEGYQISGKEATIRKAGDAIILEPIPSSAWPKDFFEHIRIEDPAFVRPEQDTVPPAPSFEVH